MIQRKQNTSIQYKKELNIILSPGPITTVFTTMEKEDTFSNLLQLQKQLCDSINQVTLYTKLVTKLSKLSKIQSKNLTKLSKECQQRKNCKTLSCSFKVIPIRRLHLYLQANIQAQNVLQYQLRNVYKNHKMQLKRAQKLVKKCEKHVGKSQKHAKQYSFQLFKHNEEVERWQALLRDFNKLKSKSITNSLSSSSNEQLYLSGDGAPAIKFNKFYKGMNKNNKSQRQLLTQNQHVINNYNNKKIFKKLHQHRQKLYKIQQKAQKLHWQLNQEIVDQMMSLSALQSEIQEMIDSITKDLKERLSQYHQRMLEQNEKLNLLESKKFLTQEKEECQEVHQPQAPLVSPIQEPKNLIPKDNVLSRA